MHKTRGPKRFQKKGQMVTRQTFTSYYTAAENQVLREPTLKSQATETDLYRRRKVVMDKNTRSSGLFGGQNIIL